MKQQISTTLPPCNSDDYASEYVIVKGLQTIMPPPRFKPPRRAGCFPVIFTVLLVHPSPSARALNLVRYKTKYEFWVNCDDFFSPESGAAAVNRLIDLMNVPFPLQDVQLLWTTNVGNKSNVPVANWKSMVVHLSGLLRQVKDLVRKQEDDNSDEEYPFVKLEISKFVKLSEEELETAARESVNGEWHMGSLKRAQKEMEWRMVVLQARAIERVNLEGGGEEERCGICLRDMSVGSEVARLPCSHYTHESCILSWLRINNSCPFCRFKIAAINEGKTRPTPDHYFTG